MGAAAQFNVTVRGKGGHAAMPHTTVDPVVAGAAVVTALQVSPAWLDYFLFCQLFRKGQTSHPAYQYGTQAGQQSLAAFGCMCACDMCLLHIVPCTICTSYTPKFV